MPTLKTKALDALGQPVEATRTYTPISPHARNHAVFNPERTVLRGDHEAVKAAPALWVATDATSEEKGAARAAHRARGMANLPVSQPDPTRTRVLGLIPPERRRVALRDYHDIAGNIVHAGSIWDADDEFVKGNPSWFAPEAA